MKVKILTHTPNMERTIAIAGKLCYSNKVDIDTLDKDMSDEQVEKFINHIISLGHGSIMEHASITFAIEGVSRALLAELSRHRIGVSLSVRSQRYCSEEKADYVVPPTIKHGGEMLVEVNDGMKYMPIDTIYNAKVLSDFASYRAMVDAGVPKEDARMILPNACHTRMIVTMNVRSLHHFFNLRCCNRAQWEIRKLANEMLKLCKELSPLLFKNAGASCVSLGYCPEGSMCCGKAPTLDKLKGAYSKTE